MMGFPGMISGGPFIMFFGWLLNVLVTGIVVYFAVKLALKNK